MDESLVKKAFKKVNYTKEQIEELKQCMHPKTGPMYFMTRFMKIQHPTKGEIPFQPFPYQHDLIDCYHNYKYSIALVGRQLGKCVDGDTTIKLRNKKTGEIVEMTIEEFHNLHTNENIVDK